MRSNGQYRITRLRQGILMANTNHRRYSIYKPLKRFWRRTKKKTGRVSVGNKYTLVPNVWRSTAKTSTRSTAPSANKYGNQPTQDKSKKSISSNRLEDGMVCENWSDKMPDRFKNVRRQQNVVWDSATGRSRRGHLDWNYFRTSPKEITDDHGNKPRKRWEGESNRFTKVCGSSIVGRKLRQIRLQSSIQFATALIAEHYTRNEADSDLRLHEETRKFQRFANPVRWDDALFIFNAQAHTRPSNEPSFRRKENHREAGLGRFKHLHDEMSR